VDDDPSRQEVRLRQGQSQIWEWRSRVPWIDYAHTDSLKVARIPRHNRQAMHQRSGRDESIAIGTRIWHMESSASLSNSSVNRQNATGECGQNMSVHPSAQNLALLPVASFDEKDAYLQFQYRDCREIEARCR
jgi:hypothetical protein